MNTDPTVQNFILQLAKEKLYRQGDVYFSDLKPLGIYRAFRDYCQREGCTLSITSAGQEKAPWIDFRTFLLHQSAAD